MHTVFDDDEKIFKSLEAGADGYLLKTVESDQLCQAIVRVLAGEPVISPEMMTKFVAAFRTKPHASPPPETLAPVTAPTPNLDETLSAREREILLLVAHGDSNKVIARQLDIAETTVKVHVQGILRKLQLSSRVQAAVYAAAHGLV